MGKEYVKMLFEKSSMFLLLSYVAGFVGWNFYLSHFGFFEYDLLQTRFLSAGFLILIIPITIFGLFKKLEGIFLKLGVITQILCYLMWVFFFSYSVFPYIPQYFGGAKPYPVSFIANSSISESFKLMGVSLQDNINKSIETLKSCKIYENKNVIIAGFIFMPSLSTSTSRYSEFSLQPNRVLIIDRNEVEAQSVLPNSQMSNVYVMACGTVRYFYGVDPWFPLRQKINQLNAK